MDQQESRGVARRAGTPLSHMGESTVCEEAQRRSSSAMRPRTGGFWRASSTRSSGMEATRSATYWKIRRCAGHRVFSWNGRISRLSAIRFCLGKTASAGRSTISCFGGMCTWPRENLLEAGGLFPLACRTLGRAASHLRVPQRNPVHHGSASAQRPAQRLHRSRETTARVSTISRSARQWSRRS